MLNWTYNLRYFFFLSIAIKFVFSSNKISTSEGIISKFFSTASQSFTVLGEANIARRCRCSEVEYCREKSFKSRKQCVSTCSHFLQYFADNTNKAINVCFNEHSSDYETEKKYDCNSFEYCTKENGKEPVSDIYIPKYNLTHYHNHYRKNITQNIFSETPQNKKNHLTYSYFKKFQHCVHGCVKNIANNCYNNEKKCSVELNEYNKATAKQIEYCTCMSGNVHVYMRRGCTCMHEKLKLEKLGGICELVGNHLFKMHFN